jgi:hypothetical protein
MRQTELKAVERGQSFSCHTSMTGRMIASIMQIAAIIMSICFVAPSQKVYAQAVRVDVPLLTSGPNVPVTGGPLPQALWVANSTAYICTHPSATLAACQAAPITTYTDSTAGTPCLAATPLVQFPGSTCTASTGITSNLGFWYSGGIVDYWIASSYGTYGPFTYTPQSSVSVPVSVANGGTGAITLVGAWTNIFSGASIAASCGVLTTNSSGVLTCGNYTPVNKAGDTMTGALNGTSASFSGTVAAGATVAAYSKSVSCTNGNNNIDHDALQTLINSLEANAAANGRASLQLPEDIHCNVLPPSPTATEALLITGPVSLAGKHGVLNFQMPAPTTASVTACSVATVGAVSTATITAANTFVAKWTGFVNGFTGGCSVLNGMRFVVSSIGLSSSQFQFIVPMLVLTPISTTADTATATATMLAIRMAPNGSNMYGVKWENALIQIVTAPDITATTVGGDVLGLDCTAGELPMLQLDNLLIHSTSAGFGSIFMDNLADTNGCTFNSHFKDLHLYNGLYFQHSGDKLVFDGGMYINPFGDALSLDSVQGAVGNVIENMTVEGQSSSIHLRGGPGITISRVESAGAESQPQVNANIYIDGTDPYNPPNGTLIVDSHVGVDVNRYPNSQPNLLVDKMVANTTIRNNTWYPQITASDGVHSDTPHPAVVNNGGILNIEGTQLYSPIYDYSLYGGTGAYGPRTPTTVAGGGKPIENDGLWSENPNNWAHVAVGSGSSVTVASTPTAVTLPNGQPGFAYAVTLTLGANTSGYSATLAYTQAASITLPNPHGIVYTVYAMPTSCPILYSVAYISALQEITCGGTYNGWTQLKYSNGSQTTGAGISLYLNGGSIYSTTMTVYLTMAQISQNDSDYVQTTTQAVPLSYGNDPAHFAGPYPVTSPNGFLDSSTLARPNCGAGTNPVLVGTLYTEKGTGTLGADRVLECNVANSTYGTYAWQELYQIGQQRENALLQSGTGTLGPWTATQTGTALAPVITNAPAITDPFGNTGTVQEVVMDLNGDVTPGDISLWQQIKSGRTNPHTVTMSGWFKAKTGSPIVDWGNLTSGYGPITLSSSVWTYFTRTDVSVSTADDWFVELVAGSGLSTSADFYVFGLGLTYNGGAVVSAAGVPTTTTTTAIDNTANAPILCNPTIGSAGQFCDPTQTWVTPGSNATQVNGAAVPASAKAVSTNSSNQIIASPNTLGCLDGYDHLPCTVYSGALVTGETTPAGALATIYTPTVAGRFRVTGGLYTTTASSTSYVVQQIAGTAQTGGLGLASNETLISYTNIGTATGLVGTYGTALFNVASGTAIQAGTYVLSGTNTGGVWSHWVMVERLQ